MHPYRTVVQISLIFSIFDLVLAAPIWKEIHEARRDQISEDVATAVPKNWWELEAVSNKSILPRAPPGSEGSPPHSPWSDGSTSPGHPDPYLSLVWELPDALSSWMFDSLPRLSHPALSHDSTSLPPGSSTIELPDWVHELAPEMPPSRHHPASSNDPGSPRPSSPGLSGIELPDWVYELAPEMPPFPHPPASSHGSESPSSSGSESSGEITETRLPERLQEFAPSQEGQPFPHPPASLHGSESPSTASSEITEMTLPERLQEFAPPQERPPPPPPPSAGLASPASPQHAGSSSSEIPEMSIPEWMQKFEMLGFRE